MGNLSKGKRNADPKSALEGAVRSAKEKVVMPEDRKAILSLSLFVLFLSSCSAPRNPASDQINSAVEKIKEENGESSNSSASLSQTANYKALMEKASKMQIVGETFGKGKVPLDLAGITFYPRTTAAVIEFLPSDKIRITTASGEQVDGSYSVLADGASLELTYKYKGQEKKSLYNVQTSKSYAMLNLQDIENENKPVPLMVVAAL